MASSSSTQPPLGPTIPSWLNPETKENIKPAPPLRINAPQEAPREKKLLAFGMKAPIQQMEVNMIDNPDVIKVTDAKVDIHGNKLFTGLGPRSQFETRNRDTVDANRQINIREREKLNVQYKHLTKENTFLIPGLQNRIYTDDELAVAFNAIDTKKRGSLAVADMRDALHMIGENASEAEIRTMIRLCDADGGKDLSYDEFRSIFQQPPMIFKNYDTGNLAELRVQAIKQSALAASAATEAADNQQQQLALKSQGSSSGLSLTKKNQKKRLRGVELGKLIDNISMLDGGCEPQWIKRIYERCLLQDVDGAGFLNYQEFLNAFNMRDSEDLTILFKHFDVGGIGDIEVKELITGLSLFTNGSIHDKCKFAFLLFDDDSSAFLERSEMLDLLFTTQIDKTREQVETCCDDIYRFLGLQQIHRVSFDLFLKVCSQKPLLVLNKVAIERVLKRHDERDLDEAYADKVNMQNQQILREKKEMKRQKKRDKLIAMGKRIPKPGTKESFELGLEDEEDYKNRSTGTMGGSKVMGGSISNSGGQLLNQTSDSNNNLNNQSNTNGQSQSQMLQNQSQKSMGSAMTNASSAGALSSSKSNTITPKAAPGKKVETDSGFTGLGNLAITDRPSQLMGTDDSDSSDYDLDGGANSKKLGRENKGSSGGDMRSMGMKSYAMAAYGKRGSSSGTNTGGGGGTSSGEKRGSSGNVTQGSVNMGKRYTEIAGTSRK